MKLYVIVKHAGETWAYHFEKDPKTEGATKIHSARWSHSGKIGHLKETYEDLDEAEKDCIRINKINPAGDYAVCPLVE